MTDNKIISRWLYSVAFLVFALVIVGGATRLTGSGLSITEWRPVTGTLPPLNYDAWIVEFERYKAIPQYLLINKGMSLEEFQVIYFWEWGHRLLARITGFALLIPFIYFVVVGKLKSAKAWRVFGIGCLIALQGFVGWIMVASGLKEGMVAVAPLKLMFHLTLAAIIFSLLLREAGGHVMTSFQKTIFILLIVQIALGALVAGNGAGKLYNTFPLMDGGLAPPLSSLFIKPFWFENFIDNVALVQLNHRLTAYLLTALVIYGAYKQKISLIFALAVLFQATIGVATLIMVVPFSLALAHQAAAFLLIAIYFLMLNQIIHKQILKTA
jgi:heme a synthase